MVYTILYTSENFCNISMIILDINNFINYSIMIEFLWRLMLKFNGTIIIKQEEKWFVATCLENDIASQGKTIDEAVTNLKEAIALYYEDEKENLSLIQKDRVYITTLEMAI
jgi:predicted RNase H-like HicB family nuclease